MGAEPEQIRERFPDVLAITGPQALRERGRGGASRRCRRRTIRSSIWCRRRACKLTPRHYAYLKISEGCNNRCSFCIIPKLRGDLVSPPGRRRAARGRAAGEGRRQGAAGHLAGHQRLRRRHQIRRRARGSDREVRTRFFDLASELGALGAWVRLHYVYPYPHVDEVIPLMAEGKILPYLDIPFQHASPDGAEGDAPARQPGEDARAHPRAGARSARTSPSARPSSSASPARPRRTSTLLLDWLQRGQARPRRLLQVRARRGRAGQRPRRRRCRDEVKEERWHRFMARAAGDQRHAARRQGRQAPAGDHRRGRRRRSPTAAPSATRRRSTAPSTSPRAGRCAPATS